jgi:hypothetical protein
LKNDATLQAIRTIGTNMPPASELTLQRLECRVLELIRTWPVVEGLYETVVEVLDSRMVACMRSDD